MSPLLLALPAPAQAPKRVEYRSLVHPQNMERLDCAMPDETNRFVASSAPGQIFFADEPVHVTLAFKAAAPGTHAIEIREIAQRRPDPGDAKITGLDDFGPPDLVAPFGEPIRHPLAAVVATNRFEVRDLPVPARFGTYALVLCRDRTRTFLGTVARVPRPNPAATVDNTLILGEGLFFRGAPKDPAELYDARAAIYARMGVKGVRCELGWNEDEAGKADWAPMDRLFQAAETHGVKILATLGGTPPWTWPFAPNQTPAACATNWDGNPYSGRADWMPDPKHDARYGKWITEFCRRYGKEGKGALWGVEHYNEPWEGGGISGWAGDLPRYRALMKLLANSAREASRDIPLFAASSIMNTEDKFFSEGAREYDAFVDVFTDHYVRPCLSYGPLAAAAHGKVSMETESWMVNSEYRLPLGVCLFVATGQRHINPWHPRALFDRVPGARERYLIPTPTVVATAAFNALTAGKPFQRIVFREHLPWVFQFGADDDPAGLLVMFGQLLGIGARSPAQNAAERPWAQVEAAEGGTITLRNDDGLLQFLDLAGNPAWAGQKSVEIPLTYLPTYVRCAKGPAAAAARLREAVIRGKRPVEILPLDFSAPVGSPAVRLRVKVHNCLPQKITGTLAVKELGATSAAVSLAPGETRLLEFPAAALKPDPANRYPMEFAFKSDAGEALYQETLNAAIAPRRAVTVDGDLAEWEGVPGIMLAARTEKMDAAELARMPWLDARDKLPDGTFVEMKMAWDAENLFLALRVNDPTPQTDKPRRATANEEDWFHSASSDLLEPYAGWLAKTKGKDGRSLKEAGRSFAEVPWVYRRKPTPLLAYEGDRVQFALDVRDDWHDLAPNTDRIPLGFSAVPDSDYEYSAYLCADGQGELWRLLAPGMPRVHGFPRQPKPAKGPAPGAVDGAKIAIRQEGAVRVYEIALPRAEIPDLKLQAGTDFGFVFQVGNHQGPKIDYGEGKAACKLNGLTLHPYYLASPNCGIRWTLIE